MRKTIASLEQLIKQLQADNDSLTQRLREEEQNVSFWKASATRHREVSDRLLNVLEWNSKEGKGYASGR